MGNKQDEDFMRRAIELSRKARIVDRVGNCFGCVIVKDGEIVSEGYNQIFARHDPTWHAEMHAIREACSTLASPSLKGCTMYTSTVPCPSAIYWSRIDRVYYGASNEDVARGKGFETDVNVFEGDDHKKPPEDRTRISFTQLLQPEAAAVFSEFKSLPADHQRHY